MSKSTTSGYKYKDDEIKWGPLFQSTVYDSKGYHREQLIIEPPACFSGQEGSYTADFDKDNKVFVLKWRPNTVVSNPYVINCYLRDQYGIITSDDSERHKLFKKSSKVIRNKWYTFRHDLKWAGKPALDLDNPYVDFTEIENDGEDYPVLIVNICSIKAIVEETSKMSTKLSRNTFKSPIKVKRSNTGDATAQMASMIEMMMKAGLSPSKMTPEMKLAARKMGIDTDKMLVDGDDESSKKKRGN